MVTQCYANQLHRTENLPDQPTANQVQSMSRKSIKVKAKRLHYRYNRQTRNLLARAAADPSFILDFKST